MSPAPALTVNEVSKVFTDTQVPTVALKDASLEVAEGEFICLLGRSGCGKSTLLSMIAGLASPTSGAIDTHGNRVGMMFQDANLFPWLTVRGNIELALRLSGIPKPEWDGRVQDLLAMVELPDAGQKRPHQLSGGMRQRVSLARALAQECRILLMDEPFASLDALTRDTLHEEIARVWAQRGLTIVFVTHNVREAARLADRVVIMSPSPGRIVDEVPIGLPRPRRLEQPEVAAASGKLRELLDHYDLKAA
ncbi:MAG: ABC transporter ATP-binding protein [Propionibacteriaceae bacterium]|jgi:NitT/TauT family transport system ATP-binding protein|nr:ABC transporter ATP-binding protein [Propionibacteriaceae bacterium]